MSAESTATHWPMVTGSRPRRPISRLPREPSDLRVSRPERRFGEGVTDRRIFPKAEMPRRLQYPQLAHRCAEAPADIRPLCLDDDCHGIRLDSAKARDD